MNIILSTKKIIKNISLKKLLIYIKNLLPINGFALWREVKDHNELIEILRKRVIFTCICGVFLFLFIVIRLVNIMVISPYNREYKSYNREKVIRKADIVDRNGELLATSLTTSSCYADPSVVIDINEVAEKLSKIHGMPSGDKITYKLKDKSKHFVWLARHVHPSIQEKIMDLGLPGIFFQKDCKRIYIHGLLFSHIIGCTDIDCNGICGIEKEFNNILQINKQAEENKTLVLSLDLRLQTIIREELLKAIEKYKAKGGHVILMKTNGEILAMVSLPDFDPNNLKEYSNSDMFNRSTLGVFEQGSILKVLTAAIALDSGSSKLGSVFDASSPIRIGRFQITDFKGKGRPLTLAESIVFSSNIGCAKIAQKFGAQTQKKYFKKFGMLDKLKLEIPEMGSPIVPKDWTEVTCMTVAYGYGIAVSPLQLLTTITSIVNDGIKVYPTILCKDKIIKAINEEAISKELIENKKTKEGQIVLSKNNTNKNKIILSELLANNKDESEKAKLLKNDEDKEELVNNKKINEEKNGLLEDSINRDNSISNGKINTEKNTLLEDADKLISNNKDDKVNTDRNKRLDSKLISGQKLKEEKVKLLEDDINKEELIKTKTVKKERIVSSKTSQLVRELMRAVVLYGTGKKVDIDGIEIFCKTGTAYKRKGKKGYGGNSNRARLTTFVGGFPKNKPQYMLLVSLDEPQGIKETYNYATAGWNVVPTAKKIISRLLSWLSNGEKFKTKKSSIDQYIKV